MPRMRRNATLSVKNPETGVIQNRDSLNACPPGNRPWKRRNYTILDRVAPGPRCNVSSRRPDRVTGSGVGSLRRLEGQSRRRRLRAARWPIEWSRARSARHREARRDPSSWRGRRARRWRPDAARSHVPRLAGARLRPLQGRGRRQEVSSEVEALSRAYLSVAATTARRLTSRLFRSYQQFSLMRGGVRPRFDFAAIPAARASNRGILRTISSGNCRGRTRIWRRMARIPVFRSRAIRSTLSRKPFSIPRRAKMTRHPKVRMMMEVSSGAISRKMTNPDHLPELRACRHSGGSGTPWDAKNTPSLCTRLHV